MRPSLPAPCSFWGSTRATLGTGRLPIRRALPFNGHSPRSAPYSACLRVWNRLCEGPPTTGKSAVRRVYEYG
jgi:hypothetical protein